MAKKRQRHRPGFRQQAAAWSPTMGCPLAEAAQTLCVNEVLLRT